MLSSSAPSSVPTPWGSSAGIGYIRAIPTTSQIGINNGYASWPDGFVPLNMTPPSTGGVPPFGQDSNGILNFISAGLQWAQVGGKPVYSSSYSTTIGGYPNGAILQSSDGTGFWRSIADNNTINPDTVTAYVSGTTNWLPHFFYGSASIALTNANVTLTSVQYAKPVIILTGTLTGNVQLIFPAIIGEWLIENTTTGAYVITAKTASGTGVTVYSGNQTIFGDATNIYTESPNSAIQQQSGNYVADTSGAANTITVAPSPVITAYVAGLELRVKVANTTTGATNINVNGLGNVAVRYQNLTPLGNSTLLAGGVYTLVYDGTYFQLQGTGNAGGYVVITSTCSWTVPTGVTIIRAMAVPGGGAGEGSSGGYGYGGGASGGPALNTFTVTPGQILTATVGLGGTAVTDAAGNSGGTTSLTGTGVSLSASGGAGATGSVGATGGSGGANGGNGLAATGGQTAGGTPTASVSLFIRSSPTAAAGGGAGANGGGGAGGWGMPSIGSPTATAGTGSTPGANGSGFGSGGGGCGMVGGTGGYGNPGIIYIEW